VAKRTLKSFAAFLTASIAGIEEAKKHALEKGAEIIAEEAKRVLGTKDYDWLPLAPLTIAGKATGNSPGLETGEMRDSVEYNADSHEAYVG